jgi:hypothetical protein
VNASRRVALLFGVLVAATIAGAGANEPAAPGEAAVRSQIDAMCAVRDARSRANDPDVFARIYEASATSASWRVADDATLRRIARDPNIYSEVARVWSLARAVAIVRIEVRSLDYRADARYCFRPSGTLARVDETSSGMANSDDEQRYLDESGEVVARTSRLALIAPNTTATVSPDLKPATPDLYPTVRTLPFYALWSSRPHERP